MFKKIKTHYGFFKRVVAVPFMGVCGAQA